MSGIAGILSVKRKGVITKMLRRINHRGTIEPIIWKNASCVMGALWISNAHERPGPSKTPSDERAIVLDGRLTNSNNLLMDLQTHELKDKTDAEIVLHAFEDHGSSLFRMVEGEFALALCDGNRLKPTSLAR